jgi:hypothetical protein
VSAIFSAAKRTKRPSRILVDLNAAVIDSQVVKTTRWGSSQRGYDGAQRLAGRKRHILINTGSGVGGEGPRCPTLAPLNFSELRYAEVRRIYLLRTTLTKGEK